MNSKVQTFYGSAYSEYVPLKGDFISFLEYFLGPKRETAK